MRETGISESEADNDYQKSQILLDRASQLQYEIKGWIDYVNSIEPTIARKYYAIFNTIKW
jgi:hypothetical protein